MGPLLFMPGYDIHHIKSIICEKFCGGVSSSASKVALEPDCQLYAFMLPINLSFIPSITSLMNEWRLK
jgi:hypothetical protein